MKKRSLAGLAAWATVAAASLLIGRSVAQPAPAPAPNDARAQGAAIFAQRCAGCHEPNIERAPSRSDLANYFPEAVKKALTDGPMKPMAAGLTDVQLDAVSLFLAGREPRPVGDISAEDQNKCPAGARFNPNGPSWNGWSPDLQNTRFQSNPGLTAADVPKLKVKWAFAIGGGRYAQPSPVGNRVFVGSSSGRVYALDAQSGCVAWTFSSDVGVRTAPTVTPNKAAPSGYAVYVGDYNRFAYALDADSGKTLWKVSVESMVRQLLTGGFTAYKGVLYVPTSSFEESGATVSAYECCRARGALVALDTVTGKILWKTYTIKAEPKAYRKNATGVQMYGPAGAAIWSAPTIDPKRGLVYVATGDSYTDIDDEGASDAVIAFDLKTGAIRWKTQVTRGDNFVTGCRVGNGPNPPNCPTPSGPDHDFGSSPILKHVGGRDIILAGQKSAVVHAFDADTGKILWQTRVGEGGALGGIEWGMAADDRYVYAAVADRPPNGKPGLTALDILTGKIVWHVAGDPPKCGWQGRCQNGYSAPPTAIKGLVLSGAQDGHLRAFDPNSGQKLWDFDTAAQTYQTVNGSKTQRGGPLDGSGPTFAGGRMYMISGYNGSGGGGWSDNVLLAFSVEGR